MSVERQATRTGTANSKSSSFARSISTSLRRVTNTNAPIGLVSTGVTSHRTNDPDRQNFCLTRIVSCDTASRESLRH